MKRNSASQGAPSLDAKIQSHIGRHLRDFFSATVNEPVPERFRPLLDQLEGAGAPAGSGEGDRGLARGPGAAQSPDAT